MSFANINITTLFLNIFLLHGEMIVVPLFYSIEIFFLLCSIGYILFSFKHGKFVKLFIFILIHALFLLLFFIVSDEQFNTNILLGILGSAYFVPVVIIALFQWRELKQKRY